MSSLPVGLSWSLAEVRPSAHDVRISAYRIPDLPEPTGFNLCTVIAPLSLGEIPLGSS